MQTKPRIRCKHHQPTIHGSSPMVMLAGMYVPLTWTVVQQVAFNGDEAARWPTLANTVRAAITLN